MSSEYYISGDQLEPDVEVSETVEQVIEELLLALQDRVTTFLQSHLLSRFGNALMDK